MLSGTSRGRCAVLGKPIAHSLSPVMHRRAYAELGLDWTYEAVEVDEAGLPEFLDGLDDSWRGLSLTMPLKRVAVGLVDEVSDAVRSVSALNTIVFEGGRRIGDNTDIPGMLGAFEEHGVRGVRTAAVVGAGATAASALAALRADGLRSATLVVREPARAEPLAELARTWGVDVSIARLDEPLRDADLLVSTAPSAAIERHAGQWCMRVGAVFDVIYDPWPTALASAATVAGLPVVSGLDLLAHQAALQVELMTGRTVPASILRTAVLHSR
ncbi:shikimate dehydrogenase [Solicola gregarius]|uniref:Shikimate dehydrogenase n=1 Tax=Solicola gregarius TaxID=2908642 RepID=A0AA46YJX6_9ACTN|nr:shikimate dehydrogenase [Solicola gregarius]UYM04827.1 shikimate dehydrogenase [Solicola gregarius]